MVDTRRVRQLRPGAHTGGPVIYVMGRDFRVRDNWALLHAQELACTYQVPLAVLVHLGRNIIESGERQHAFLIDGLKEVAQDLEELNIPFFITFGDWRQEVKQFVEIHDVGTIVTDFSPLREMRWWWDEVARGISVPVHEVDAHNIVPCWIASEKEEYAAHTFRRKLYRHSADFAGRIPSVKKHPHDWGASETACWPRGFDGDGCAIIDWEGVLTFRKFDHDVPPVAEWRAGERAAEQALQRFLKEGLHSYAAKRNDPVAQVQSQLSPYIHFGFLSAQYVAHEVRKVRGNDENKTAFLEELVVRRELAENFCFFNPHYNTYAGLRDWAKKTLDTHRDDEREYLYSFEEFESAKTHDALWNAAQMEMVKRGKMHGYMRMYWAKKILEWSKTPEEAVATAITLNDRYELDGRDPSGYVGVLWSIGGVHDRPWAERPVFGKIRYMNLNGCKRKFDVAQYIENVNAL